LAAPGDAWVQIDKPADARVETFIDQILLRLRSDWTVGGETFPAGSLLAADLLSYLGGRESFAVIFKPSERKALAGTSQTKNYLILNDSTTCVAEHTRLSTNTTNGRAVSWQRPHSVRCACAASMPMSRTII
jgi:prolyl oligopeptidase PreP (S9A serine peptidase family)